MVSGSHLEPMTRFLFSVWRLRVSWFGAPSLTWGWVCNSLVQLLLGLARAVTLGSISHRTQTILYCLIWDSPNLEGQVPIFISPRNIQTRCSFRSVSISKKSLCLSTNLSKVTHLQVHWLYIWSSKLTMRTKETFKKKRTLCMRMTECMWVFICTTVISLEHESCQKCNFLSQYSINKPPFKKLYDCETWSFISYEKLQN
jgi:hypothetical protein